MKKTLAQLIAEWSRLKNQNRVLLWLLLNKHDSELTLILASADEHGSLDDLLRFMAWAFERGLLPDIHRNCDHDDQIPF